MTASAQRLRSPSGRLGGAQRDRCITPTLSVTLLLVCACGSAPPTEHELAYAQSMRASIELATNPTEELALERAAALPDGEPTRLANGIVVAGPIYPAASGRRCREMTIGPHHRLACEDQQAEVWVFVPDVFSAGTERFTTGGANVPPGGTHEEATPRTDPGREAAEEMPPAAEESEAAE